MPLPTGQISYSDVYSYYGQYPSPGSNVNFEFNYQGASQTYVRRLAGWGNTSAGTQVTMASLQGKAMISSDPGADPYNSNRPPTIYGFQVNPVDEGYDRFGISIASNYGEGGGNGTASAIYQPYAVWVVDWYVDSTNIYYGGRARDGLFAPYYDAGQANAWWRGGGFQAGYAQTYFSLGFPYGPGGGTTYSSTGYTYLR